MPKYNYILDENGERTGFVFESLKYYPYGVVYEDCGETLEPFARVRVYNNHMAPYENLATGVLYDSLEWLCENVTPDEVRNIRVSIPSLTGVHVKEVCNA